MSFFQQVEGEAAILVENGVYRQCDLYSRDGYLFAKAGGGFVRLMVDGSTSKARARLDFMSWSGPLFSDGMGRLGTEYMPKAKALPDARVQALLGVAS